MALPGGGQGVGGADVSNRVMLLVSAGWPWLLTTLRSVALGDVLPAFDVDDAVKLIGLLTAGIRIGSAYVASSCGKSFGSCVKL